MAEKLIVSSAVHDLMQSADVAAIKTLVVEGPEAATLNLGGGGEITSNNGVHMGIMGSVGGDFSVHTGSLGEINGQSSVHMGGSGVIDANASVHMGVGGNIAVGADSSVHMGNGGTVSGENAVHMGNGGTADKYAQVAIGGGPTYVRQFSIVQMECETIIAETADMTLLDATNFVFATDKLYSLQVDIVAKASTWFHTSKYTASFVNKAGTTSQVGTTTVLSTETTNNQSPTVTITHNGNDLKITCTSYNFNSTNWYAVLQVTELGL